MKVRLHPVVLSLACCVLPLTAARASDSTAAPFAFVDPDDASVAEIRQLGDRTIDQAGNAMMLELRRELAAKAPALAVGGVHLKNYKLPAMSPGQPAVTAIHRTSLKVRNPANAPDAADRAALELVQRQLVDGDHVSPVLVQKVALPGQAPEWRVYRPLAVLKQCLDCHGDDGHLAAGVADTLKVFYPTDTAINYRPGEWRGMFRVSITVPAKGT
jgi:mono/diheme cytochrome c family protein